MVVKVRTQNGWSYHECSRLDALTERVDVAEISTYAKSFCLVFADGTRPCKKLVFHAPDGRVVTVLYDREAYLLNNNGDTINSL